MKHLFRIVAGTLLCAGVFLILALGLARHDRDLLAPFDLFLTLAGLALYLLPAGMSLYRDCRAGIWIAALDVFLGWTVLGWFIALGLAANCKERPQVRLVRGAHHPAASH